MSTHLWYRLKKSWPLFPGMVRPVCATFLAGYYARCAQQRSTSRVLVDALLAALFHAWIPFRTVQISHRYGLGALWRRTAAKIAHRRFADPGDLALFEIQVADDMDQYIRRFEYAAINRRMNPCGWRDNCVLNDKSAFYERCLAYRLPQPETHAVRRQNTWTILSLPRSEVIMKPVGGTGGQGVSSHPVPSACLQNRDDFEFWLQQESPLRGNWIVQARLRNHHAIRPIALDALSTTRITSIIDERGVPEIVAIVQRFPLRRGSVVDNVSDGGLAAPVDLHNGILGEAMQGRSRGDLSRRFTHHPENDAPICGLRLPDFQVMKALVVRAHLEAFSEYTMIGWDVALTESGPVFIEGNPKPSILLNQRIIGCGAGSGRLGELIRCHLDRAPSS